MSFRNVCTPGLSSPFPPTFSQAPRKQQLPRWPPSHICSPLRTICPAYQSFQSLCAGLGAPINRQWESTGLLWAEGTMGEGTVHAKAGRWEKASYLNSSTIYPKGRMNTLVQKPEL